MASLTSLKDLPDDFFLCPVCLDQLKEPKQLPCLHRYCKDCLKAVIGASQDGSVKCPMCKQDNVVPENGVDDFKTDFHMKSMLEFIILQKCFGNKDLKKCISCSKHTVVSAYCFKCREFLCDECYEVHVKSKMLTDHQPHSLKLDDIETKKLTLDKLAALTEDPMCDVHVNENAKLCCSTCGNLPVCVICTYSKHKDHDLHDVTELATSERELLEPKLAELNIHKVKLYDLPKKVKDTTIKLKEIVVNVTESFIKQHKEQAHKIRDKFAERINVRERGILDIENLRKEEDNQTSSDYEKELNQLREKYDNIRKTTKRKYDDKCKEFKKNCNIIEEQLSRKVERLDLNLKNLTTTKELLAKRNEDELKDISESFDQIINRYENLTITSSSVLASNNDWTYVQCIPDIRAACEPLIEEMKKEFPDFTSSYVFPISDITKVTFDDVTETEHEESVIDVLGIKGKRRGINGIASSGKGHIVITGDESEGYTHITVINKEGKVVRKDQIQNQRSRSFALRYCCSLSNFKVVTACLRDEVSIYDVHGGVLSKRNISDVINDWPHDRFVSCVAFDPLNNHIIVGTGSRYMYVFDDQLRYSHTITLPDVIKYSDDIAVHRGSLLVCDSIAKKVYAVTMMGNLIYEFMRAFLGRGDWRPISVCTDKNQFIYMLWSTYFSGKQRSILLQYSQNGRKLLTKREVDGDARCITILEVDGTDKLLIATNESIKLYTYGMYQTSVIPCLQMKGGKARAIIR
ncbi:hypothetical protein BSL78_15997 [Apostichopus japonicus]|uniref:RING-type domain-containing protein n=1 Tax=Stichopus japonicus TaxID=307972 RepID=A0A2G8KGM3_STIJA|nr:hypothetical protein BSL78_15997 [Apostichopus japonicus]